METLADDNAVTISPYEVDSWRDARDYYTNGGCADLAWAIRQKTGWDIGLLFAKELTLEDHDAGHAYAIREDGMFVDINGVHTRATMAETWAGQVAWNVPEGVEFVTLTDAEAMEIREAYGDSLAARNEAMDAWWARRLLAALDT